MTDKQTMTQDQMVDFLISSGVSKYEAELIVSEQLDAGNRGVGRETTKLDVQRVLLEHAESRARQMDPTGAAPNKKLSEAVKKVKANVSSRDQAAKESRTARDQGDNQTADQRALDAARLNNDFDDHQIYADMLKDPSISTNLWRMLGRRPTLKDIYDLVEAPLEGLDLSPEERAFEIGQFFKVVKGDPGYKATPELEQAIKAKREGQFALKRTYTWQGQDIDIDDVDMAELVGAGEDGEIGTVDYFEDAESIDGESTWKAGGWLHNRKDLVGAVAGVSRMQGVNASLVAAAVTLTGGFRGLDDDETEWKTTGMSGFLRKEKEREQAAAAEKGAGKVSRVTVEKDLKESKEKRGQGLGAIAGAAASGGKRAANFPTARVAKGSGKATAMGARGVGDIAKISMTANKVAVMEQKYGGPVGGLVAMEDETLAGRLATGMIGGDDLFRVDEIMKRAKYSPSMGQRHARGMTATRKQYAAWQRAWQKYYEDMDEAAGGGRGGRGGRGGDGAVVTAKLPSEVEVAESMRTLFRSWFQRDPSQGEISGFKGTLDQAIINAAHQAAAAQENGGTYTEPNEQAMLMDWMRKGGEYKQLFGNKPGGQDEAEYAGTFAQATQRMFGDVQNDEAIRAGMRAGTTQASIGFMAGSKAANDSSSFQDRLASAASIVAQMT